MKGQFCLKAAHSNSGQIPPSTERQPNFSAIHNLTFKAKRATAGCAV